MRVSIFGQTALAYMAGMIIGTATVRLFGNTGWWLAILLFACMGLYDAWRMREHTLREKEDG